MKIRYRKLCGGVRIRIFVFFYSSDDSNHNIIITRIGKLNSYRLNPG